MTTRGDQRADKGAPRRLTPRDLRRRATPWRRLGLESLENRELLSATTVHYRLEAQDNAGNAIASIAAGSNFQLAVFVQDTRTPPPTNAQGVFAGFLNVTYTASLASAAEGASFSYGPLFDVARLGDLTTPGQIVGAGASRSSDTPPGNGEQLLWKLPLHAVDPGTLSFVASFDATGGHDTLLYGSDQPVPQADILFDTLNLPVTGSVQPSLFIADASTPEGNNPAVDTPLLFSVLLANANSQTVTVAYATSDLSATAPGDYATTSATLTFSPGTTQQFITVPVHGDSTPESNETFRVTLSAASNANLGAATATGTITNDDASPAAVAGRWLFYNQSAFDGSNAAQNASDDGAIATDKSAYIPNGSLATFANVTSFTRGINGIMVDLAGGGNHTSINANDFVFKVGNNNSPSTWTTVTATPTISVRAGAGTSGSDRVTITWASGSIRNTWLEVQVKPTANTGLSTADVFFWGSKIGDTGQGTPAATFLTSAADKTSVLGLLASGVGITGIRDFNRDNNVTAADATVALGSLGSIVRLNIGAAGPFTPTGDSGVASTLASANDTTTLSNAFVQPMAATNSSQATSYLTTPPQAPSPAVVADAQLTPLVTTANWQAKLNRHSQLASADAVDDPWLDDDLLALLTGRIG